MRPNIILIVADDMGYGDCGCYGSQDIRTPCLDTLATEGVRFTDFHSNGAVCSPTRAALLTGRYQQRTGVEGVITAANHRHVGLPLEERTFADLLRSNGYRTAIFGKWHLGYAPKYNPTHRGFDEFRGFVAGNIDYKSHIDQIGEEDWWVHGALEQEEGYTTDLVTEHGVRFIERMKDEPFVLYLAHECPHYPYQGPRDSAYRTPGKPDPILGPRTDQDVAYREMMESMDQGIGRIAATVKQTGIESNTLIFFFSDNGPSGPGSSGPLRGRKGTLWEGGHRVPAVARWPGVIPSGRVTGETAIGMDLFPTMMALSATAIPKNLEIDGVDLTPVLKDDGTLPPRDLFWRHKEQRAVRSGHHKLLINLVDDVEKASLFSVYEDVAEKIDIADKAPDIVTDLTGRLKTWESTVSAGVERLS